MRVNYKMLENVAQVCVSYDSPRVLPLSSVRFICGQAHPAGTTDTSTVEAEVLHGMVQHGEEAQTIMRGPVCVVHCVCDYGPPGNGYPPTGGPCNREDL